MHEWIYELIWIGIGSAFFLAMLTHLRVWSIARDARRIADALESATLRSHSHQKSSNEIRAYLE